MKTKISRRDYVDEHVFYNPHFDEIIILSALEFQYWDDFNSALEYLGAL